jgi:hypothetical protein
LELLVHEAQLVLEAQLVPLEQPAQLVLAQLARRAQQAQQALLAALEQLPMWLVQLV